MINRLANGLNARADEVETRVLGLEESLKEAQAKLASIYERQISAMIPALVDQAKSGSPDADLLLAIRNVGSFGSAEALRKAVTDTRAQLGEDKAAVVCLAGVSSETGKPVIFVATNEAARKAGIKAGDLVRSASQVLGGGGGGKPDFAQGGGQDASRLDAALKIVGNQAQAALS